MTIRIFLQVREFCLDVSVRQQDVCGQLGMCVCQTHPFSAEHVLTVQWDYL